jgi:hypothetical protein
VVDHNRGGMEARWIGAMAGQKRGDAEEWRVRSGEDLEVTSVWTPARRVSVYIC